MDRSIIKLSQNPNLTKIAARWFAKKWNYSMELYEESINECIKKQNEIPQWYIVLDKDKKIIAGAGIIENDFHIEKNLFPNLCALYVEEEYRNLGIAKSILDFARKEVGLLGYKNLFLVTDHTNFYEKCGWSFFTMVKDEEGVISRMYTAPTL